jgi:hypothetical protein
MELPHYTDDPLMDQPRKDHGLLMEPVERTTSLFGAACSAGDWIDPRPYDRHAHAEGFDQHMHDVQRQVHQAAAEKGGEA